VVNDPTNLRDADAVIDLFDRAADAVRSHPHRTGSVVTLPAHGRLLATGDLHDNPAHLQRIIELAALDSSPDHHVVLHEMIHGEHLINSMDFSHRMLARVAELILKYPAQVHPVLANHELSQMTGKGVSKGAGNSVELFNDAIEFVFGDRWDEVLDAVKGFIRAMPLALRSEGGVLCAHSLPAERMMKHFDRDVFDRALTVEDYAAPSGSAYVMVWGRQYTAQQAAELAQHWNVQYFCLGHQHVDTGIELVMDRVLVLNSDHESARVLPLDLAALPTPEEALMYAMPLR
jgi:hypothetical protein